MAEIVNLRLARKARDRKRAEESAAQNRAKYGLGKAEKARQKAEADRDRRSIDGARRDSGAEPQSDPGRSDL
jgi:hypothetical protein